jgi:hypothetical protein
VRQPRRDVVERVEQACRLLDRNCSAPFLDELDQPVRGVDPELHASMLGEHVFVFKHAFVFKSA